MYVRNNNWLFVDSNKNTGTRILITLSMSPRNKNTQNSFIWLQQSSWVLGQDGAYVKHHFEAAPTEMLQADIEIHGPVWNSI